MRPVEDGQMAVRVLVDAHRGAHEMRPQRARRDLLELFLRFFLLFSTHGFAPVGSRRALIWRAVDGSSEHALGVSEELKERVFEALRFSIEGLLSYEPNKFDAETDLELCQSQSFVFLYRLLFILYAEDRGYLPYQKNDVYTRNRSLARFRIEVATKLDNVRRGLDRDGFKDNSVNLWSELKALCDIVDSGNRRYEVPPYNGGLFSADEHPFLEEKAIPDKYVASILDQLSRASHRSQPELGLFRVDYRDLAIQQLGSVYEGLLELRPRYATEDMIVVRSRAAGNKTERIIPLRETPPAGFCVGPPCGEYDRRDIAVAHAPDDGNPPLRSKQPDNRQLFAS
jgi:hypothetical protein